MHQESISQGCAAALSVKDKRAIKQTLLAIWRSEADKGVPLYEQAEDMAKAFLHINSLPEKV